MEFSNICTFIEGAIYIGHVAGRTVVVTISSAIPPASFPITLAVAGAIRMRSAPEPRDTCGTITSSSGFSSKTSV